MTENRIDESMTSKSRIQKSGKVRVIGSATSKPREAKPTPPKK